MWSLASTEFPEQRWQPVGAENYLNYLHLSLFFFFSFFFWEIIAAAVRWYIKNSLAVHLKQASACTISTMHDSYNHTNDSQAKIRNQQNWTESKFTKIDNDNLSQRWDFIMCLVRAIVSWYYDANSNLFLDYPLPL